MSSHCGCSLLVVLLRRDIAGRKLCVKLALLFRVACIFIFKLLLPVIVEDRSAFLFVFFQNIVFFFFGQAGNFKGFIFECLCCSKAHVEQAVIVFAALVFAFGIGNGGIAPSLFHFGDVLINLLLAFLCLLCLLLFVFEGNRSSFPRGGAVTAVRYN